MVDRLFQIVYLLMEYPQMTAKELAGRFEVSERTIYRDLDKLTLAGIPIYTNQGKNGGISILPDYVLNKAVLTEEEKAKIFESLNALNALQVDTKDTTLTKLKSFLGDRYYDWLEIEFSSWGNTSADAQTFSQIKTAIFEHRYMEITYSGNHGSFIQRKIKPLKLCFKDQAWYLYAYCCLRKDYRFFKLRRISQMSVLEEYFEAENPGKVLQTASVTQEKLSLIPVHLEIHPDMAFRAYEELPDITIADNGYLHCKIEVSDLQWLTSYILSYGSHIRVIEPEALKEKVKQEIFHMQNLY